jgi:hypothetical protein
MIRAFQWDLARQTERPDWLAAQLPRYADWGYGELHLHLEDAVEYPSLPGVARPGAYTHRQLAGLVDAATKAGIRVVPIANLLGHTQYLIKVPALRELNELRAADGSPLERGQICPVHPRTPEIAAKLLRDLAPFCTAGRVHVGLDESFHLGRHPLSRVDIARRGLAGHFAAYVGRLLELARGHGLNLGIWADMLYFLPGAIPRLPRGIVAYDWYYYPFARHPRVELFNFAERDLTAPLRARGIEYWGCPMNSGFRHEPLPVFADRLANLRSWWDRCHRVGAQGFLVTSWETGRLAAELTTVLDAAAASLWLDRGALSPAAMLERGFARVFGRATARGAARAALASDRHAFAGYARWEPNHRWDLGPGLKGPGPAAKEFAALDRLAHAARALPAPLAASLAFRRYLAARDAFIRRNAAEVFRLRRVLHAHGPSDLRLRGAIEELAKAARLFSAALWAGDRAAQAMWARTREGRATGPNVAQLHEDARRLHEWQHWLIRAREHPAIVHHATPFCGAWQLTFSVGNFAPALQQVVVEARQADGTWTVLAARHTIEFRAASARPRSTLTREFSVGVPAADTPLRVAVRGVGQVRIARITLTNGLTVLTPRGLPPAPAQGLGRPSPRQGLPELDWDRNQAVLNLHFRPPAA